MRSKANVMLSKASVPGKVDKNNRIYSDEVIQKAYEDYIERMGTPLVPVCINPPYLMNKTPSLTEICTVSLKDKIGTIDISNIINHGETAQLSVDDNEMLKHITKDYTVGLRYTTMQPRMENGVTVIDNMKLICYDLLPKEFS